VTSFTDRENAIEAHYAMLELAAFQERLHEYKALGLRVAARLGLQDSDAQQFALEFAEHIGIENDDVRARVIAELNRYDLHLSPAELRDLILADDTADHTREAAPSRRSWIEYLITQLMMLFGADQTTARGDIQEAPPRIRLRQSFLYFFSWRGAANSRDH
jgi:hypothetical protein